MLSVHSDWFGKLWTSGATRQRDPRDCKEMFVPSETTAAIHWHFQLTGSVYHQPAVIKILFLSMTGNLVEGGHREAARAPLQRLWAAACWLPVLQWPRENVGVGLSQMDALVEGHPSSAATTQRGNQGCQACGDYS